MTIRAQEIATFYPWNPILYHLLQLPPELARLTLRSSRSDLFLCERLSGDLSRLGGLSLQGIMRRPKAQKRSEQPASWRAFTKPTSRRAQHPEEPVVLDFGARAQDSLKRITPLSADLAAHGRTRTLALQKLHRICQTDPLAGLTSLDLSHCGGLRRFAPLQSLLPTLKNLYLFGCELDDVPSWGLFSHANLLEQILNEYIEAAALQSGQPLFQSVNSAGTEVTGRVLNRYDAWAAVRKRAKAAGFLHLRRMSHLAGNRHHNLPGKRRTARARPTDGWT